MYRLQIIKQRNNGISIYRHQRKIGYSLYVSLPYNDTYVGIFKIYMVSAFSSQYGLNIFRTQPKGYKILM